MIKQEQLKLQTHTPGTLAQYFTTFTGQTSTNGEVSYLLTDSYGTPIKIVDSVFETQFIRGSNNNFIPHSFVIFTGNTIEVTTNTLKPNQKTELSNQYVSNILSQYKSLPISAQTSTPKTCVLFKDVMQDDMYINIDVSRTIDILDTFNVYNIANNEIPTMSSPTGVVFGKLEALQNISDENGNKIRIPLKNTPVAIFNSSNDFPSTTSTDENGNRLTLNIKENSTIGPSTFYFNTQSQNTDFKYLTDTSKINGIPDQYKYSSLTNENGEFILYNVPIGNQTFMYEVDLLKQGLTADEVALNFFPYPTEDNPVIDKVPHFFFRQLSINIIPAWGDFQTGYTQLNIAVTLDLRKWATYCIPPVVARLQKSDTPLTIEQLFGEGINQKLTCEIRDMTKQLNAGELLPVEIVEIQDISNRNFEQILEWSGEFKQKKNKAEFVNTGFNFFKLPANLYDPTGIGTTGQQGVWLNAYEFKMYYLEESIHRSTGTELAWINFNGKTKMFDKSNFDLNKNVDFNILSGDSSANGVGIFPYEKPWSTTYPTNYNIPQPPAQFNPNKNWNQNTGGPAPDGTTGNDAWDQVEPRFLDGDLAGFNPHDLLPTGYGLQNIGGNLVQNEFAREVTTYSIYKYEELNFWGEEYSNGWQPVFHTTWSPWNTQTQIKNGEIYQRVEAGYAYWLKPQDWPRIRNNKNYDKLLETDYINGYNSNQIHRNETPGFQQNLGSYIDHISILAGGSSLEPTLREDITLILDRFNPWPVGQLNIYRMISPQVISNPLPPPLNKFVRINFGRCLGDGGGNDWSPGGFIEVNQTVEYWFGLSNAIGIQITNLGRTPVVIDNQTIPANNDWESGLIDHALGDSGSITLPGNDDFDITTNSYRKANYIITIGSAANWQTGNPDHPEWGGQNEAQPNGPVEFYATSTYSTLYIGGAITTDPSIHINLLTDVEDGDIDYYVNSHSSLPVNMIYYLKNNPSQYLDQQDNLADLYFVKIHGLLWFRPYTVAKSNLILTSLGQNRFNPTIEGVVSPTSTIGACGIINIEKQPLEQQQQVYTTFTTPDTSVVPNIPSEYSNGRFYGDGNIPIVFEGSV